MIKFLQRKCAANKSSQPQKDLHLNDVFGKKTTSETDHTSQSSLLDLDGSLRSVHTLPLSDDDEETTRQAISTSTNGIMVDSDRKTTDDSSSSSDNMKNSKRVSFSQVQLYYHANILGDNPSVSSGPPLALSDKVVHTDSASVDGYEADRQQQQQERSSLVLSRMEREDRLRLAGFGRADFRDADMEIQRIKKLHQKNAKSSGGLMGRLLAKRGN